MTQRFVLVSSAALTLLSFAVPARAQCPLGEFFPTGAGVGDLFGASASVSGDVLAVTVRRSASFGEARRAGGFVHLEASNARPSRDRASMESAAT